MKKSKVIVNALSAVSQVILTGIVYFFLYRFLIKSLGSEQLGIWSLVLATSSVVNLANLGITSSLVKLIAEYKFKGDLFKVQTLISTSFISVGLVFLIFSLLFYFIGTYILRRIISSAYIDIALSILPFSLICLWINSLGGVFSSVLEGFQKNYLRNIILSIGSILMLLLTYILLPKFKLKGVAYAQLIQSVFVFISGFFLSTRLFPFNKRSSIWEKESFRQIISYGLKFQVVSIFSLLFEPITKALISKLGNLSIVGFYEMASRLISQSRSLIVSANQVVIPIVSEAAFQSKEAIRKIYEYSLNLTILFSTIVIAGLILFVPIISIFWIGNQESVFEYSVAILAIANFVNLLCGPSYFGFLGMGELNPLIYVHVVIAVINLFLGYFLGLIFGGQAVIVSWGLALSIGSILLIIKYHKLNKIGNEVYLNKDNIITVITGVFFSLFFVIYQFKFSKILYQKHLYLIAILQFGVFVLVFSIILFQNKTIKKIIKHMFNKL